MIERYLLIHGKEIIDLNDYEYDSTCKWYFNEHKKPSRIIFRKDAVITLKNAYVVQPYDKTSDDINNLVNRYIVKKGAYVRVLTRVQFHKLTTNELYKQDHIYGAIWGENCLRFVVELVDIKEWEWKVLKK